MSFAIETKSSLCDLHLKNLCCKKSLLFGMLFYGARFGISDIVLFTECEGVTTLIERLLLECYGGICDIDYYSSGFRLVINDQQTLTELMRDKGKYKECSRCNSHYLRGIFLSCGSINSPDSSYRLELSFKRDTNELIKMLAELNFNFKVTERSGENVIYLKESESIEDFLNYIGALNAAFTIMNEKIKREIRNDVNRQKNCDTANIKKTVNANRKHIEAINKIKNHNKMGMMPENLRETAKLRLEYPDVSLAELADLHDPKITKSGLNHRLKKIVEFSER